MYRRHVCRPVVQPTGSSRSAIHSWRSDSGSNWKFIRLQAEQVIIDTEEYYLKELPSILGILAAIAEEAIQYGLHHPPGEGHGQAA